MFRISLKTSRWALFCALPWLLGFSGCDEWFGTPPNEQTPTVTLEQDQQTLHLKVGQRFLLALGDNYVWEVTVDDPAIVSRVPNVAVVKGAQGLYEAHSVGSTTLNAVGDPLCRQEQPPCAAPTRLFRLNLVVK